ncbi:Predicted ATP-dependent carboligase, ATP-grasp superfamily [Saccharopolyspora antimicrobica]|uniref:ATP-grasp superfamily ATP-dependent carboligase n=1 Tax=Saccharopolyspora antimicrobica TaxID=455193 RepID=A0A1I4SDJ9_9PSEU|nr:carboxylate--amine ligase [Saccharopolyspora antimicrobica]RKT87700.1 putative ATP-grasp superfamily ATP-dependent carboligase [Saccharopolyspora antimicrobica]SFM62552.1 Predicted ATP-dependent carboligase, ATP-grasp superfamily [Saccharopolyspora antimicrobica]
MYDTTTPAVVFKLDPNVLHHGGLGVIRSLGRAGVPVYAVHEDSLAPAAHSRYVRGRWLWSPDPGDAEAIRFGLMQLAQRIGRPAVLIPTDDAAAIFLAEHGDPLRMWFQFAQPPHDLPRLLAGKYTMYELCRRLGVPCAQARLIRGWDEALEFADRVGYPLVAKLATPWRPTGGKVRSTTIVEDSDELARIYRRCDAVGGLMLQEFIPGGPEHDWFFHGYCDADSVCRPAFTGVKERSYPAHAGLTSLGRCEDNESLLSSATALLAKLSYTGIVDLDFRWDDRDQQYKLLDFNPRLGAQFRLFRDSAGLDVALASYLDLTGQPVPAGRPEVGRRFLVENYDPIAALRYWSRGELGLRAWAGSLRRVHERAWFARDDLLPFALMCTWMACRAVARPWRRGKPHPELAEPQYVPGRNYDGGHLERKR